MYICKEVKTRKLAIKIMLRSDINPYDANSRAEKGSNQVKVLIKILPELTNSTHHLMAYKDPDIIYLQDLMCK